MPPLKSHPSAARQTRHTPVCASCCYMCNTVPQSRAEITLSTSAAPKPAMAISCTNQVLVKSKSCPVTRLAETADARPCRWPTPRRSLPTAPPPPQAWQARSFAPGLAGTSLGTNVPKAKPSSQMRRDLVDFAIPGTLLPYAMRHCLPTLDRGFYHVPSLVKRMVSPSLCSCTITILWVHRLRTTQPASAAVGKTASATH